MAVTAAAQLTPKIFLTAETVGPTECAAAVQVQVNALIKRQYAGTYGAVKAPGTGDPLNVQPGSIRIGEPIAFLDSNDATAYVGVVYWSEMVDPT